MRTNLNPSSDDHLPERRQHQNHQLHNPTSIQFYIFRKDLDMNSNLRILFLLVLFARLPLQLLLPCPFVLAIPVRGHPLPLDRMDQRPTHTYKPHSPLSPSATSLSPPGHLKQHPPPGGVLLNCGPATQEHGSAAGCVRRKRDGTVVRVPEGGLGRPRVRPRPLIYSKLLQAGLFLPALHVKETIEARHLRRSVAGIKGTGG